VTGEESRGDKLPLSGLSKGGVRSSRITIPERLLLWQSSDKNIMVIGCFVKGEGQPKCKIRLTLFVWEK